MENINYINGKTLEGEQITFDGFKVEYYTRDESSDEDLVELHFASGHVVAVFNVLDQIHLRFIFLITFTSVPLRDC